MTRLCLLLLFLSAPALAGKGWVFDVDKGEGAVTFSAIGRPSALKIKGKGTAPKGSLRYEAGKVTGTCAFDLQSLDTGISMRNEHMKKKYLHVDKFPRATLSKLEILLPEGITGEKVAFKAAMELHGVEKPIEGVAKLARKGDKLTVETTFTLKTGDFGIDTPSFAGITLAESIDVAVEITAPLAEETQ